MTTRDEQIRAIAYRIWEEQGRPHGRHFEHWLQAEMRWLEANRPATVSLPQTPARPALQARPPARPASEEGHEEANARYDRS
jgi:hypothetical protein